MPEKADTSKPFILYFDSLNQANSSNMQALRNYIEQEFLDKALKTMPADSKSKFTDKRWEWSGLNEDNMPCY